MLKLKRLLVFNRFIFAFEKNIFMKWILFYIMVAMRVASFSLKWNKLFHEALCYHSWQTFHASYKLEENEKRKKCQKLVEFYIYIFTSV